MIIVRYLYFRGLLYGHKNNAKNSVKSFGDLKKALTFALAFKGGGVHRDDECTGFDYRKRWNV
ncbi:MAG: hypothetical protein JXR61_12095, partial [Prolixibacteraceae bacterium]|nr:hypothetical protein [Prolixibacteraceae bacterium]